MSENKTVKAFGGAISNESKSEKITEIVNSVFVDNIAQADGPADTTSAQGGGIYSTNDIKITSDKGNSIFSGNKIITNGKEESNAIYIADASKTLTLNSINNGTIQFDDKINGEIGYSIKISGDSNSKIILNNNVDNANVSLEYTNLSLGNENIFDNAQSLSLNSGSISLVNNSIGTMNLPALNLNGNTNLAVDADLANSKMDTITADNYSINKNATLNVNYINILSEANKDITTIRFATPT